MRAIYVEKNIPKMLLVKALSGRWPEVCWTPFSATHVEDLPEQPLPSPRWVRVKNLACGICASDLSLLYVHVDPAIAPAAYPGNARFYLGHEVVSTVVEVGAGVTRFKPGDRVLMDTRFIGAHCLSQELEPVCQFCARGDYNLCENASANRGPQGTGGGWGDGYVAHETEIYPAAPDLSLDDATLAEPMAVALRSVLRRPPQPGQKVLVIGMGIIGLLTVQAARAVCPDCHIAVIAKYPHQKEAALRCGANTILDRAQPYQAVAALTGGKYYSAPMNKGAVSGGFEVIYDCIGSATTVEDSLRWARAGGAVVLVGIDLTRVTLDLNPVWYQEVDLIGSKAHGRQMWQGQSRHTYDVVTELLRAGKMHSAGLITHRFRFEEYKQAIAMASSKARSGAIKVVFEY